MILHCISIQYYSLAHCAINGRCKIMEAIFSSNLMKGALSNWSIRRSLLTDSRRTEKNTGMVYIIEVNIYF